ncbi:lysozyme inhibitor LprI family protein [Microbulbifer taiwanensis]|uniref:lysozyme inhibitor LprI family protein n=1 Tax=Microbulbifer taiwanensis TaxID=986746 RepID=UPI003619228D
MKRLLLIALAVSASALADDRGSSWQEGCRPDEQTQLELNQCAQRYYQSRDAELNKVYKTTMQSLPAEQQKRLREQQRAWLKSRDPDCRAQVEAEAAGDPSCRCSTPCVSPRRRRAGHSNCGTGTPSGPCGKLSDSSRRQSAQLCVEKA